MAGDVSGATGGDTAGAPPGPSAGLTPGAPPGAFTSDLSIADFALCDQLELVPLSQVMGSSIYQVGYQESTWPMMMGGSVLMELNTLSVAWNSVREHALGRLAQEAERVGADAVVGVDLRTGAHDFAEGAIEYVVMGTAVRRGGAGVGAGAKAGGGSAGKGRHRGHGRSGQPVLTELSVADYAKLVRSGFEPLGVVAWSSVFFVAYGFNPMLERGGLAQGGMSLGGAYMQNFELTAFTQALYSAREQVMGNMDRQAVSLGADGVVGMRIAHTMHRQTIGGGVGMGQRDGLSVTFHAIGTAIRQTEETTIWPPEPAVDMTS
jgi:uncharacterized protein YbjQ (UPF0145 family)